MTAQEIADLSDRIDAWSEQHDADKQVCVGCESTLHTPNGLDPTPLSNLCAQRLAGETPRLVARIVRLETELAMRSPTGEAIADLLGHLDAATYDAILAKLDEAKRANLAAVRAVRHQLAQLDALEIA